MNDATGTWRRHAFVAGAVAMAVAVLATVALRATVGQSTLAEIIGNKIVLLIPGNLFEFGIQTFGESAKKLLFVGLSIVQILLGGALALVLGRMALGSARSATDAAMVFLRVGLASLMLFGAIVAVSAGFTAASASLISIISIAVVYGLVLTAATWRSERPVIHMGEGRARSIWYPTSASVSRRGVLVAAAGTAAAATGVAIARAASAPSSDARAQLAASASPVPPSLPRPTYQSTSAPPTSLPASASAAASPTPRSSLAATSVSAATPVPSPVTVLKFPPGEVPDVTPVDKFYKVSKNFFSDPQVDGQQWHLGIDGLVKHPASLSLADITGMKSIVKQHTLTCISNDVGGNLIGNGIWKGVPLASLLKEVGVGTGVRKVVFHGADGYADSIPLERAMDPGTILAYQMNGATLVPGHGYPLRALVPDIYGMKNAKWLTKIELVNTDFQGYWQRGGWSDPAIIKTMSRIDVARGSAIGQPVTLSGVAFAGERGIARVELTLDGGKSWLQAQVKNPNKPNVWTLWLAQWTPTKRGTITLTVRAVDGSGQVQSANSAPPFPDGSSGYHSVQVKIS